MCLGIRARTTKTCCCVFLKGAPSTSHSVKRMLQDLRQWQRRLCMLIRRQHRNSKCQTASLVPLVTQMRQEVQMELRVTRKDLNRAVHRLQEGQRGHRGMGRAHKLPQVELPMGATLNHKDSDNDRTKTCRTSSLWQRTIRGLRHNSQRSVPADGVKTLRAMGCSSHATHSRV